MDRTKTLNLFSSHFKNLTKCSRFLIFCQYFKKIHDTNNINANIIHFKIISNIFLSSKINFHFFKAPQNDRLNTLQNCSNAIRFIKFEAYYETET
jgi:hypothetical protein